MSESIHQETVVLNDIINLHRHMWPTEVPLNGSQQKIVHCLLYAFAIFDAKHFRSLPDWMDGQVMSLNMKSHTNYMAFDETSKGSVGCVCLCGKYYLLHVHTGSLVHPVRKLKGSTRADCHRLIQSVDFQLISSSHRTNTAKPNFKLKIKTKNLKMKEMLMTMVASLRGHINISHVMM